jgi:hypothetical protein
MILRALLIASLAVIAAPAWAQTTDVVSTARGSAPPSGTAAQIADWVNNGPPLETHYDGDGVIDTPGTDRGLHGEIGALFGDHGTYAGSGVVSAPLGENGRVSVAASGGQFDGRRLWIDSRNAAGRVTLDPLQPSAPYCAPISTEDRFADPALLRHVGVPAPIGAPGDCLGTLRAAR